MISRLVTGEKKGRTLVRLADVQTATRFMRKPATNRERSPEPFRRGWYMFETESCIPPVA